MAVNLYIKKKNIYKIKKGSNELNETLLKSINDGKKIYMVPSKVNEIYFLRFAICARTTEKRHIDYAWQIIKENADLIIKNNSTNSN